MKRRRVLVIDDDPEMRSLLRDLLERGGYTVAEASSGREGLRELFAAPPEIVLLDVAMAELDGWRTLERIRDLTDVPVVMLTARAAEIEKVRGLAAGADDYVTKPFGRQELLARLDALLRRTRPAAEPRETYVDALLEIDFAAASISVHGVPVRLTPLELRLLGVLVRHPNQVLSREQLLRLAWRDPFAVSPAQVKLTIGYLRRKLGLSASTGPIETVRGFGYRYRPPQLSTDTQ